MEIRDLEKIGREIWGDEELSLSEIIVRLGKVFGDICRYERNAIKDSDKHNEIELKKEFGTLIFNSALWAAELGFDPEECVKIAIENQRKNKKVLSQ